MDRCATMIKKCLSIVLLAYAPLCLSASTPNPNLKGIFIGQSFANFDAAHGGCSKTRGNTGMCYIPTTEFGIGNYVRITAFFVDGKCVDAIASEIKPDNFEQIISGLTEKFSKHGKYRRFIVSNSLGVHFMNQEVVWRFGKIKVKALKYSDTITESTVELYSPGMIAYQKRIQGTAAENAAKM